MASKFLNKRTVPDGFKEILSNLTTEILREQPSDIIHFAASYFEHYSDDKSGSKFLYDKSHVVSNPIKPIFSRADTSNSNKSEKMLSKEYASQLYQYGIDKCEELDGEPENQTVLGELYINIVSAKDLKSPETSDETYCVAFLTSDPLKIIKTNAVNEAINPSWDHQDKLVLKNLNESDFFETNLIFQVFSNDNGTVMVGEANVDIDFALRNPGEWELKLTNGEGAESGFLNLQVNFLKETDPNENEDGEVEIGVEEENSHEEYGNTSENNDEEN